MKKSKIKSLLLAGALMVSMIFAGSSVQTVSANSISVDPMSVTFSGSGSTGSMKSDFKNKTLDQTVSRLQPGDEAVFTINIKNSHAKTTNWYMENRVLNSLETSANDASGGAYTYTLTYKDSNGKETPLFGTIEGTNIQGILVGGDEAINANTEGLEEATYNRNRDGRGDDGDWFYLDELASGKGGQLVLKVLLDGETQGNSYQDTVADLAMNFAVELVDTTPNQNKVVREKNRVVNRNQIVRPVKTGDDNNLIPYFIAAGVAGLILLFLAIYSMKKRKAENAAGMQSPNGKGGV